MAIVYIPPAGSGGSGGGEFTKISTATGTGAEATIVFTDLDTTYTKYKFVLRDVDTSAGADSFLHCRLSTDNGSTYKQGATDYRDGGYRITSFPSSGSGGGNLSSINLNVAYNGRHHTGELIMLNATDTATKTKLYGEFACEYSGGFLHIDGGGLYDTVGATDAIQFYWASGNFAAGSTIELWGGSE